MFGTARLRLGTDGVTSKIDCETPLDLYPEQLVAYYLHLFRESISILPFPIYLTFQCTFLYYYLIYHYCYILKFSVTRKNAPHRFGHYPTWQLEKFADI